MAINIIFDGPPSPDGCRFIEVENDDGCSIRVGKWIELDEGLWALRITEHDIKDNSTTINKVNGG